MGLQMYVTTPGFYVGMGIQTQVHMQQVCFQLSHLQNQLESIITAKVKPMHIKSPNI